MRWQFRTRRASESIVNPNLDKDFSDMNHAARIVRETLQNSLDAVLHDSAGEGLPVRVRFSLHRNERCLDAGTASAYVGGLKEHLHSLVAQHKDKLPADFLDPGRLGTDMPFLAVEDFGTVGLIGDWTVPYLDSPDPKNHYYYFVRNVGNTAKGEREGGSWGYGKYVFHDSSRISSVLAYTVRDGDPEHHRLLIGKAELLVHTTSSGELYPADGYFADTVDNDEIVPVFDNSKIDNFASEFSLARTEQDTGLSLVIPFPVDTLKSEDILAAAMYYYFKPIIEARLVVEVEDDQGTTVLDGEESLRKNAPNTDFSALGVGTVTGKDMVELYEAVLDFLTLPDEKKYMLRAPPGSTRNNYDALLSENENVFDEMRPHYDAGRPVVIRIPVVVNEDGTRQSTYFWLRLRRDEDCPEGRAYWVRDDLAVPNLNKSPKRLNRSFVLADERPIATFLRSSEPPSHGLWPRRGFSRAVKEKYESPASLVGFVLQSPDVISDYLVRSAEDEDVDTLAEFFGLATDGQPPRPPPPPQPENFDISENSGSDGVLVRFKLRKGESRKPLRLRLSRTTTESDSPARASELDFNVAGMSRTFDPSLVAETIETFNRVLLEPLADEWSYEIDGFNLAERGGIVARVDEVQP